MKDMLLTLILSERLPIPENKICPNNMSRTLSPEMRPRFTILGSSKKECQFQNFINRTTPVSRRGGYIYICGKISMAEGVENALKGVLTHIGNMDAETVEKTFEDMRKNLRYQEDIFG